MMMSISGDEVLQFLQKNKTEITHLYSNDVPKFIWTSSLRDHCNLGCIETCQTINDALHMI